MVVNTQGKTIWGREFNRFGIDYTFCASASKDDGDFALYTAQGLDGKTEYVMVDNRYEVQFGSVTTDFKRAMVILQHGVDFADTI